MGRLTSLKTDALFHLVFAQMGSSMCDLESLIDCWIGSHLFGR